MAFLLASCANEPETVLSSSEVDGEANGDVTEEVPEGLELPFDEGMPVDSTVVPFPTTTGPAPASDDDNAPSTTAAPDPSDGAQLGIVTTTGPLEDDDPIDEASVIPTTAPETTVPNSGVTTTTYPVGPNGQPGFFTTADPDLSGYWGVVGVWNNGQPLDDGFERYMVITGRRLEGHDACNPHSHGLIYATTEGPIEVVPARIGTENECSGDVLDAFRSASFDATRWGFTDGGNLVLSNDTNLVEFELLEETFPTSTPSGVMQLDSLWFGPNGLEHDGWEIDNQSGVELRIDPYVAQLSQSGCEPVNFAVTSDQTGRGEIRFVPDHAPTCDDPIMLQTNNALVNSNYHHSIQDGDFLGLLLWDDNAMTALFRTPLSPPKDD